MFGSFGADVHFVHFQMRYIMVDMKNATTAWRVLNKSFEIVLRNAGYEVEAAPGFGGTNVWKLTKNGKSVLASVRTTRDRWFAFVPRNGGENWKTMDDVDAIVVASVDDKENPRKTEVYLFPMEEVRKRFRDGYQARKAAGHTLPDDRGMWIALDSREGNSPSNVGSGLGDEFPPIGTIPFEECGIAEPDADTSTPAGAPEAAAPIAAPLPGALPTLTIADVIADARQKISGIAGVGLDAVKIDLKIGY